VGCGFDDCPSYCNHKGIDLFYPSGALWSTRACPAIGVGLTGGNVYPAFNGCSHQGTPNKAKVIFAGSSVSGGNMIILEHLDETHRVQLRTHYLHLNSIAVSVGQYVTVAEVIGTTGATGDANNFPHLHFEVNPRLSDHPDWRTAAERALMPANLSANRPVRNPELVLPPLETDEELLRVIEVGTPLTIPLPASVPLPDWRPHAMFPVGVAHDCVPATYIVRNYDASTGQSIRGPTSTAMDVYPFLDAPDERIYVLGIWHTPGANFTDLWLLHSDAHYRKMVTTLYTMTGVTPDGVTTYVSEGTYIKPETRLARITPAAGQRARVYVLVIERQAASATHWVDDEPIPLTIYPYDEYDEELPADEWVEARLYWPFPTSAYSEQACNEEGKYT
jgi:murein DD-endopeptidase MepM/ murein hydrolase activator NlpD